MYLLQLQDQYGNPVHNAGVHIHVSFGLENKLGREELALDLPKLDTAVATRQTDAQGCVNFGDVCIAHAPEFPVRDADGHCKEYVLAFESTESSRYRPYNAVSRRAPCGAIPELTLPT